MSNSAPRASSLQDGDLEMSNYTPPPLPTPPPPPPPPADYEASQSRKESDLLPPLPSDPAYSLPSTPREERKDPLSSSTGVFPPPPLEPFPGSHLDAQQSRSPPSQTRQLNHSHTHHHHSTSPRLSPSAAAAVATAAVEAREAAFNSVQPPASATSKYAELPSPSTSPSHAQQQLTLSQLHFNPDSHPASQPNSFPLPLDSAETKKPELRRPFSLKPSELERHHNNMKVGEMSLEEVRALQTRDAAPSFLSDDEQKAMTQLPAEFTGAAKLVMPAYITGPISNVTLPSRLDLLGRRGFRILASFFPRRIGNAVVGWAPVLTTGWKKNEWRVQSQLFLLPLIFSKSMARILLFLRVVFLALVVIFILDSSGAVTTNPGKTWAIGTFLALVVMAMQAMRRKAPDGVMAFCRSLGAPECEEYMFSYCWKVEPENVRTLAKAVWKAGVGVWIDVVKLCPGDEIRPLVRTTVKRVHKVIVFLCDEYAKSPNCCVEMMEAVQHPEKVTVCIIKDNVHPKILQFLFRLKPKGLRICVGFDELISMLDLDVQDMTDAGAFLWWRKQTISGAGVPSHIVPHEWPMSQCSLWGKWPLPERSLKVGPVYLSGDCKRTGKAFSPPYLLFMAVLAVCINSYDMYDKYNNYSLLHSTIDYVFLGVIALSTCAPFIGYNYLIDTRRDCHVALRPLLASRSMGSGGVKVRIFGADNDPIYSALRNFLAACGHLADERRQSQLNNTSIRTVNVFIMDSLKTRDELFGRERKSTFDNRFSLFIWSGCNEKERIIPFTDDEIGQRLMRYLVLVVDWEKHGLAESLFSAIGVRVVDILHDKTLDLSELEEEEERKRQAAVTRFKAKRAAQLQAEADGTVAVAMDSIDEGAEKDADADAETEDGLTTSPLQRAAQANARTAQRLSVEARSNDASNKV